MLFLTDGQCQPQAFSTAKEYPLPALDWKNIKHRPIVYVLKSQVISYNADHHTFLCKPNWLSKVKKAPKQSSIKHPIQMGCIHWTAFHLSTQECIHNLKQRNDNILLNRSGGYSKPVFSQLVIKPTLLSMHSAKEV